MEDRLMIVDSVGSADVFYEEELKDLELFDMFNDDVIDVYDEEEFQRISSEYEIGSNSPFHQDIIPF